MRLKTIIDEDFTNYRAPVMTIGTCFCGGKCCTEAGIPISTCINDAWRRQPIINIPDGELIRRYIANPITAGVCFGGLEPFEQFEEILAFIREFRGEFARCDPLILYTGYYKTELLSQIELLRKYPDVTVKFGRYIPGQTPHYDEVLGVKLASDNQYAEKIS